MIYAGNCKTIHSPILALLPLSGLELGLIAGDMRGRDGWDRGGEGERDIEGAKGYEKEGDRYCHSKLIWLHH